MWQNTIIPVLLYFYRGVRVVMRAVLLRGLLYIAFVFVAELAIVLALAMLLLTVYAGPPLLQVIRIIAGVVGAFGVFAFVTGGAVGRVSSHAGIPWIAPKTTRRVVEAAENLRLKELMSLSERIGGVLGSLLLIVVALTL